MKLYADTHLNRIGINPYRHPDFVEVPNSQPFSKGNDYYQATEKGEQLIKHTNFLAKLKGIKECKCTYKNTWKNRDGKLMWSY
jgi:hypothetical protein